MKRVMLVLVVMLAVGGCFSTPQGYKMTPQTQQFADRAAVAAETVLPIASPYAPLVPYGGLILALATGILGTYLKARPYLVANKEILAGLKRDSQGGSGAANRIRSEASTKTLAIMNKAGV